MGFVARRTRKEPSLSGSLKQVYMLRERETNRKEDWVEEMGQVICSISSCSSVPQVQNKRQLATIAS